MLILYKSGIFYQKNETEEIPFRTNWGIKNQQSPDIVMIIVS